MKRMRRIELLIVIATTSADLDVRVKAMITIPLTVLLIMQYDSFNIKLMKECTK